MSCDVLRNSFQHYLIVLEQLQPSSNSLDTHKTLKVLYTVIQTSKLRYQNADELSSEEHDIFVSIVYFLISVQTNTNSPTDTVLLSSTCLAVLVAGSFSPSFAASFLISLYYYVGQVTIGANEQKTEQSMNIQGIKELSHKCSTSFCNIHCQKFLLDHSIHPPTFQQIAILHGILSCQKTDLFPYRSNQFSKMPVLLTMFHSVHSACLTVCAAQYHAFYVLIEWLKACEKLITDIVIVETDRVFSTESTTVIKILSLLASNWENPIKGVNTFVKEAYRCLMLLSIKENQLLEVGNFHLPSLLMREIMPLSWKVKGKYLVLSVVLQFVHYEEFFSLNSDSPNKIIFNIKANYSSAVISETYKAICQNIKQHNSSIADFVSEWCKWWRKPIINSLASDDKLLVQNVTNIILPWTFKTIPQSYESLLQCPGNENAVSTQLMLLCVAKETGICFLKNKELTLISNVIHHHNVQLRMEIMSILCCSPKKSEGVSSEELELLKILISSNLNIDSSPFQQQFSAQLRTLLVRIRDSLVQEFRLKSKQNVIEIADSQLDFVDWLAQTAVVNTFPGACFQRLRLSLSILSLIFDVFVISPLGNKRKEKPSKHVDQLILWAQFQGKWMFFKNDLLLNIFHCLTDFTDEVRSTAFSLLSGNPSWSKVNGLDQGYDLDAVLDHAYLLCNSPDYRNNDGGAHLLCLVFQRKCVTNLKDPVLSDEEFKTMLSFLYSILKMAREQLNVAKSNFLQSALHYPIHGLILGLQYCFKYFREMQRNLLPYQKKCVFKFVNSTTDLCEDIIQFMLNVMKKDENENCPSFLDIGIALEKLMVVKDESSIQECKEEQNKNSDEVSDHFPELDLLLSCCWHSIKNSCFLLCEASSCILNAEMGEEAQECYFKNVGMKLSTILTCCRHRGVVDACSLALNKFLKMLLPNATLHENICKHLLNLVFSSLSDGSSTSVTRRSAGLPSLCQAVVSSEENSFKRKLLPFTVEKLLHCINHPFPPDDCISDKLDLPQAHAYHILKGLVMDASLSQAILSYLDSIVPACMSGFSSPLWPIRNGALQLFGVLLPRICGQKKVCDDDSEHNLVSASELFSRCPSLKTYLIQQLERCVYHHKQRKLCSELVPVLSVIAKLSPPSEVEENVLLKMKPLLMALLDVPVWKVRDLVASALLINHQDVLLLLKEIESDASGSLFCSNKAHGVLLVLQKALRKDNNYFPDLEEISNVLNSLYSKLVLKKSPSSLLLGILLDIIASIQEDAESLNIEETILEVASCSYVGNSYFECKAVYLQLIRAQKEDIPKYFNNMLTKDTPIQLECLKFVASKLKSEMNADSFYEERNFLLWKDICISVANYIHKNLHPSVIEEALKLIIKLCSNCKAGTSFLGFHTANSIQNGVLWHLDSNSSLTVTSLSFTVLSVCIKSGLNKWNVWPYLDKWNMLYNSFCHPRSPDILRMQAAVSLSFLGPALITYLAVKVGNDSEDSVLILIGLCEGSLLLLQDEDAEIRNRACEFPSQLPHEYNVDSLQFNIAIQVVLKYMFKLLHNNSNYLVYLWNRLQNYPSSAKVLRSLEKTSKLNLFEQEYVNVFAEPIQVLIQQKELLKSMMGELHVTNYPLWIERIEIFCSDVASEMQDVFLVLSAKENYSQGYRFGYPHHVFLALKKLHSQVEIVIDQTHFFPDDSLVFPTVREIQLIWESIHKLLPSITQWFLINV